MAEKRKGMGTSKRFEIFKRDGFRCLYCGATPMQKVLRVDHVVPVADGGGDEPSNLVTACFECNAGKAARPLDEKRFPTSIAKDSDREHADQIREWLGIQRGIEKARQEVCDLLVEQWEGLLGTMSLEMFNRLPKLSQEWIWERLDQAMRITLKKIGRMETFDYRFAVKQQKYFYGILRKWRIELPQVRGPV